MVESNRYGSMAKQLSDVERCKICGAKVIRLYDNGICLMCKAKRVHNSSFGKISIVKRLLKTRK